MIFDALNIFRPRRPAAESEAPPAHIDKTPIEKQISAWRERSGELIPITFPEDSTNFIQDLTNPTVVGHLQSGEEPSASIEQLKELTIMSMNLNALGKQRNDEENRAQDEMNEKEEEFLEFLREEGEHASIICLQDFPVYRLRVLAPKLHALGFSFYGNVVGLNGDAPGHLNGQVTLVNTRRLAIKGYSLDKPELSLTPHFQGTHRVVTDADGKRQVSITHGEPDWSKFGPGSRARSVDHHATQTFNSVLTVRGNDGERRIAIGNTYMMAPSYQVERSQSEHALLKNLKELGKDGAAIAAGDFNPYGFDAAEKHLGVRAYPGVASVGVLTGSDPREVEHLTKVGERLGFQKADLGEQHTITAAGGLVGMQLDHIFAAGVKNVTAEPLSVNFTDHKVLVSKVTL